MGTEWEGREKRVTVPGGEGQESGREGEKSGSEGERSGGEGRVRGQEGMGE